MPEKEQIPLVSVYMITYNHAPFIAQALDSVLEQKTNFEYKIVIGDDCSTDGTREIIADYQDKHPGKIKVITSETNIGARENSVRTLKACRGKYIATLEGDDYWTDPLKLQKQVDFLEKKSDFFACFGGYYVVDVHNQGKKINNVHPKYRSDKDLEDILNGYTIHPRTLLFRNNKSLINIFVNNFSECYNGDTAVSFLITSYGKVKYMDHIFAAYRHHGGGIYSANKREFHYINLVQTYKSILKLIDNKTHRKILKRTIANFYRRLAIINLKEKQYKSIVLNLSNTNKYNTLIFLKTLKNLVQ